MFLVIFVTVFAIQEPLKSLHHTYRHTMVKTIMNASGETLWFLYVLVVV